MTNNETNGQALLKGKNKFILETINEGEDYEINNSVMVDEVSLATFVSGPGVLVGGLLEDDDEFRSGGGYRKRREKRKLDDNNVDHLPRSQYPYKPIATPISSLQGPNSKKQKIVRSRCLSLLHWNPNSVIGKVNSIISLTGEVKPDLISLNETRTNSTTEAYIYEICRTGYIPLIRNRQIIKNGKIVGDEKNE